MNLPQNIHTNSYHRAAHSPCFVIMRCCGRRKNLSHAIALSCRSLCFPLVCCCMMMMSNENGNYWKQHQKPEINGIKFFFSINAILDDETCRDANENSVNEKWRNFWAFHDFSLWRKNEPTFWLLSENLNGITGWFPMSENVAFTLENKSWSEKTLTHFPVSPWKMKKGWKLRTNVLTSSEMRFRKICRAIACHASFFVSRPFRMYESSNFSLSEFLALFYHCAARLLYNNSNHLRNSSKYDLTHSKLRKFSKLLRNLSCLLRNITWLCLEIFR